MMTYVKKILLLGLMLLIFSPISVKAENTVNLYLFWGNGCPHCEKEKSALLDIQKKYDNLKIHQYEVWYSMDNQKLLKEVSEKLNKNVTGVPFTVIGDKTFSGFSPTQTPKEIEAAIEYYSENSCPDVVGQILGVVPKENNNEQTKDDCPPAVEKKQEEVTLPIIGTINPKTFSLPIITIVLGVLDGFNPCAMWILLFLISILIGMNDRKKMWILGITFLLTSAFIYLLFMAAWLKLTLFIGTIFWIRLFISLVAVIGGIINIRSFIKSGKNGGCDVVPSEKREKVFNKIKKFTGEKSFYLAILGMITLAVSVNIIELACSAGLPVIYTQILAVNDLSTLSYFGYLLLYIFFFLIDDIIVFTIAMVTFKVTGVSTKFGRLSHLIGGLLMIIIGILLLFKPGLLMFG